MDKKHRIGRNDSCPCGSGKKYKQCCGAVDELSATAREPDLFAVNKSIAYKGKIGKQREDFCNKYLEKKRTQFHLIQQTQIEGTEKRGESISCRSGCCFCCSEYVEASIQECEAVVYYLYHNVNILNAFLQKYPHWREQIRENGDLFKRFRQIWNTGFTPDNEEALRGQFQENAKHYSEQNIPCPFLDKQLCSIYEVRPYTCAAYIATSPPEWCSPENPNEPEIRKVFPVEIMSDLSFYYRNLASPLISIMPIAVYETLKQGTGYFSGARVPGFEKLDPEFLNDPEVFAILQRHGVRH